MSHQPLFSFSWTVAFMKFFNNDIIPGVNIKITYIIGVALFHGDRVPTHFGQLNSRNLQEICKYPKKILNTFGMSSQGFPCLKLLNF